MILTYRFEGSDYKYEIDDSEIVAFAEHFDAHDVAIAISGLLSRASEAEKKKIKKAIGAESRMDVMKMAKSKDGREILNGYIVANPVKFKDSIQHYFRHSALSSFNSNKMRDLLYA